MENNRGFYAVARRNDAAPIGFPRSVKLAGTWSLGQGHKVFPARSLLHVEKGAQRHECE